ncbi:transposase [Mycobacterium shimoidei]|uniref:transposase n=1 Tax=Mycobacterium shimoidei TaxID=29313 RepID=UPI000A025A69|nr:transposase [Mycobacterium shimoidei]MCV7258209.1 transposase [Mycobacterium shimoidei]
MPVIARELGIRDGTLGNWVRLDDRASDSADGRLSESEREELERLRRENAELAMERDGVVDADGVEFDVPTRRS